MQKMIMNGYERNIANRLQRQMSKREAEQAICDIREGLYGDPYEQIHPTHKVDRYGKMEEEWPEQRYVVWAYFHDDYSRLNKENIDDKDKIPQIIKKSLPPERKELLSEEGETWKQYNRRFRKENPFKISNVAPEYHSFYFNNKEQGERFISFAEQYEIDIKEDEIAQYRWNGGAIAVYCGGLEAIQIIDAANKEGITFEFNKFLLVRLIQLEIHL